MYVVYEDNARASGPKVHITSCGYYQRWLKEGSDTTTWYGPYENKDEAWRICQQIARRTDMQPAEAACCRG